MTESPSPESRHEAEAALAARRDLGPDYNDPIAASLAERVEQLAAERSLQSRDANELEHTRLEERSAVRSNAFYLGVFSVGAGIPISAISAGIADLPGLVVAWVGLIGVNVAHGWSARPTSRRRDGRDG